MDALRAIIDGSLDGEINRQVSTKDRVATFRLLTDISVDMTISVEHLMTRHFFLDLLERPSGRRGYYTLCIIFFSTVDRHVNDPSIISSLWSIASNADSRIDLVRTRQNVDDDAVAVILLPSYCLV